MKQSFLTSLVPSFIKRRYTAKFVVSFLFVLLTITAVGAVGYGQVNSTMGDETRNSLESAATMQADSLDEWTGTLEYQTRFVGQSARVSEGDQSEAFAGLSRARNTLTTDTSSIHVVDLESDSIVATTSGQIEPGQSLEDVADPWGTSDLGNHVANGNLWVSDGSYNSSSVPGTQVIAFAAQTENSSRAVVLAGSIDIRVGQLHQGGTNQTTTIVNTDGSYVLQPDGAVEGNVSDGNQLEAIRSAATDREVRYTDRGESVRAYAAVGGTSSANDWVAVTSAPKQDAFAVRDAVGQNVLFIVASGIVTLGIVGVVLGRQTITPLARLRAEARAMERGDLDADLETNRTDEIGQLFGAFDSMRNSLRNRIEEVEAARNEADRTNRHLETKATEYSSVMRACADGDFTRRMDPESENEAMADIATEFNEMIAEIEGTTERLKAFADEVAVASEQATASTEEVRSASTQVSESIQSISSGAERQNDSLQAVEHEMGGLSSTVEEIASSSNEVADLAERTAQTGEGGREAADAAIEGMDEIEAESEQAVAEIEALEAEIDRIDELVEFISEVAEQTNMLALNANIEAARSSETGGDGFGVVANEVKDLAAETRDAAEDIEDLIEEIKSQTHRTAAEVQRTSEEVAQHRDAVENAAESLERVAEYAQKTNTGVQDISAATEQQAASTQEVVAMVDEAASVSEETSAEAETVAAAAEEQTSSLAEVSQAVVDLAQQASRLSTELDQFETDADIEGEAETETETGTGDGVESEPSTDDDRNADETFSFVESDDTAEAEDEDASTMNSSSGE